MQVASAYNYTYVPRREVTLDMLEIEVKQEEHVNTRMSTQIGNTLLSQVLVTIGEPHWGLQTSCGHLPHQCKTAGCELSLTRMTFILNALTRFVHFLLFPSPCQVTRFFLVIPPLGHMFSY